MIHKQLFIRPSIEALQFFLEKWSLSNSESSVKALFEWNRNTEPIYQPRSIAEMYLVKSQIVAYAFLLKEALACHDEFWSVGERINRALMQEIYNLLPDWAKWSDETLALVLGSMTVPQLRKKDLLWLSRNLGLKSENLNHKDFALAENLIAERIKLGVFTV